MKSQSPSAIVVTFNNEAEIGDCLGALYGAGCTQILLVDNSSSDKTVSTVESQFPEVKVTQNSKNVGYGSAVNAVLDVVSSEYVLVCNADVVVSSDSVKYMSEALAENHGAAIAGPTIQNADASRYPSPRRFPSLIDAVGHAVIGLFGHHNRFSARYHLADKTYSGPTAVDWVSGSCFMARTSALREVGGFDEAFFMYMEDVDLCRRLKAIGWSVYFVPDAVITHVGGTSTIQRPVRSVVAHHRSLIHYVNAATSGINRVALPFLWIGIVGRGTILSVREIARGLRRQRPVASN